MKRLIQNLLRTRGYEINRIPSQEELEVLAETGRKKQLDWLLQYEFKTILDIGANIGQFAKLAHEIFPAANIYSFEPLPSCFSQLSGNFRNSKNFRAFNVAIGDESGQMEMYENEYSPSSSLLPMATLHKESFPYTKKTSSQKVEIVRLDDMAKRLNLEQPLLVKIDVQGYEHKVIAGGQNVLQKADLIIAEMSIERLYEGQPLFDDIYRALKSLGFDYRGNYEQLISPDDGRVLQVDAIFTK